MKRKVVQIAGFTKVISLPSEWVKKNKIEKGMELEITEEGQNLIINSEKNTSKTAMIDLRDAKVFLKRFIDVYYRLGYDELIVLVPNEYFITLIQKDVSANLLGFEIVDQKENKVTIKNISQGIEDEFNVILRRIFLMLLNISKEGLNAIKSGEREKLDDLIKLEEINNKFTNFCLRSLNKRGSANKYNPSLLYNVVTSLEKATDAYAEIFKIIHKNPKYTPSDKVIELYLKVDQLINIFHKMFYTFKLETLQEFDNIQKTIIKQPEKWFSAKRYEDSYICCQLIKVTNDLHHLTDLVY